MATKLFTSSLLTCCQLECKTAALKQSEAKLAISEQDKAAHALLLQQLETLQQLHNALQSTEKKTRSDGHHLQHEHTRVQGQLETALQELAEADKVKQSLRDLKTLYEAARKEAEEVVSTRSELHTLRQQFDILQQEGKTKTAEVSTLQRKLSETEKFPAIIEELSTKISNASAQEEDLRNKLDEASTKAAQVDDLRAELSSTNATIEKLQADLTTGRQSQQQLRVLVEEKDRLTQDLTGARRELEIAQQQLQTRAELENRLRQKEEEVTRLQQIAARMEKLSQDLDAQKGESQEKDLQIASLRAELDRVKVESQDAAAHGQRSIGGARPDELEELLTQHSDISFLQTHQSQRDAQVPDGPVLNQNENTIGLRPDRRVADRSTLQQRVEQPGVQVPPVLNSTPPVSTNGTDVVPDSQIDAHVRDALGIGNPRHTGMRASSPLSSIHSDIEDDLSDGSEGNQSSPPEIPETLQDGLLLCKPPQPSQSQLEPLPDQERNTIRPSSSAMSEDLFKQHANHLTVTTDPRRRTSRIDRTQDTSGIVRGHGHPVSDFQTTMAPQSLQFYALGPVSSQYISPKHLRSGTQFGEHQSMPALNLGTDADRMDQTTPTLQRDKHQPNSAMKRKSDGEVPRPKRFERNYQNLDVRPPPRSSIQGALSSTQTKPSTPRHRQGGSVVSTPAPAPGRTQKVNKQKRTNSKRDKYGERFAQKS
jgi:hypothetical protein